LEQQMRQMSVVLKQRGDNDQCMAVARRPPLNDQYLEHIPDLREARRAICFPH
ncbi:hypothetical protein HAX54_051671, partial [Datura stramonium]|nr:hypothetical protein [Datura stramonium]